MVGYLWVTEQRELKKKGAGFFLRGVGISLINILGEKELIGT